MTTHLIDHNWKQHLINLASSNDSFLCICPFIKKSVISELLTSGFKDIKVITRLNLEDMLQGVSDIDAIRAVMDAGGQVRAVNHWPSERAKHPRGFHALPEDLLFPGVELA